MEKVFVTVRPRPVSSEDAKSSPWRISGNSISINNQASRFEFDRIFKEDCTTAEVYEARTKDIVSSAVCGFNGTVFAYGQTNSGKTYTMHGSEVEPGVIRLAVRDLFDTILEDVDREFLLRMSYMEIYNEDINDLLAPEHRKLQIHENLERGIFVAGLKEEIVATPEQVIDLMEFGESHRHIGETNMNIYSSRSHTIFRMVIESRLRREDDNIGNSRDAVRVSVLNLVDLAGSERAAKTGAEGMRLKEGSHINKSLMTLGTVIKKLRGHVPYRDSKLTRILQPSLGGNANTAIICNITLAQIHAGETKSSLQFASRALRVTNCARVNEILTDAALLKRQQKEIEELRARLQSELERERIALELQEEKKAQALRERRLQEQAKKIENLSSLVLNSKVDESRFTQKKDKRRETWCPTVISRDTCREVSSTTQWEASLEEPVTPERNMGLPRPFEELVHETESVAFKTPQNNCPPGKHSSENVLEECLLSDGQLLLNVTNRRKGKVKKKNTHRIPKDREMQCLMRKLAEEYHSDMREIGLPAHQRNECASHGDRNLTPRESEAIIVIKRLQEQVKMLEMEKSSIQQNLDDVIELATKQNMLAGENYTKRAHLCASGAVVLSGQSIYVDSEISDDVQRKVIDAATRGGVAIISSWFMSCGATYVVCEGPSIWRYLGHVDNIVTPQWFLKTTKENYVQRLGHLSTDLAREVSAILENIQYGIVGQGSLEHPTTATLEERQQLVDLAKTRVRNRRCPYMQIRPITPSILLDTICWSVSDSTSAACVYTDRCLEASFENLCRPLRESEKSEKIFKNHFLTILFPIDQFSEIGRSSRIFFSDNGFTCLQVLDYIYMFYQENMSADEVVLAIHSDSGHADRLRSVFVSEESLQSGTQFKRIDFLGTRRSFEMLKRVSNTSNVYELKIRA